MFETYCALMAPAKVPPEIVAKLEKVCLDILAKPDMKKKLVDAGFDVTAKDAKGHAARIAKEVPMFKKDHRGRRHQEALGATEFGVRLGQRSASTMTGRQVWPNRHSGL